MTAPTLPVSVVIPTLDRPRSVRAAVESILAGDALPAEIVVADQSDGERAALPGEGAVRIVHLRVLRKGLSRGRNAGIAAATQDALAFVDDDVEVERDWLRRLTGPLLAAPGARAVFTGAVLAPPHDRDEGHVPSLTYEIEPVTYSGRLFADPLFPNNMLLPRAAFAELGGFDERLGAGSEFPCAEDNDFGFRLLEAGWEIRFLPDAAVYHHGARRGRALLRLNWEYGRGQGAFYAKHMRRSDRHMLRRLARNAGYRGRRIARGLRGDRTALRELVYLAALCSGVLGWWRRY